MKREELKLWALLGWTCLIASGGLYSLLSSSGRISGFLRIPGTTGRVLTVVVFAVILGACVYYLVSELRNERLRFKKRSAFRAHLAPGEEVIIAQVSEFDGGCIDVSIDRPDVDGENLIRLRIAGGAGVVFANDLVIGEGLTELGSRWIRRKQQRGDLVVSLELTTERTGSIPVQGYIQAASKANRPVVAVVGRR